MTKISISDLRIEVDLDQQALKCIRGGQNPIAFGGTFSGAFGRASYGVFTGLNAGSPENPSGPVGYQANYGFSLELGFQKQFDQSINIGFMGLGR